MAQNPFRTTVPWEQNPMFLAAINLNTPPSGPYAYVVPRRTGNLPSDVTTFHPGQATWTAANPPAILYQFEPTAEWRVFQKSPPPPQKRDSQGRPVWERWSKPGIEVQPLLDYAILPDQIGSQEEWWYLEAVRRLDPRIHWRDIMMRMERLGRRQKNTMNQEAVRARTKFSMLSWFLRAEKSVLNARCDGVLRSLTVVQIATNTTRGSTPASLTLLASDSNHEISPLIPTPNTVPSTHATVHGSQAGASYTPGAAHKEVNKDKASYYDPQINSVCQDEIHRRQTRVYEGDNEAPYEFGRYQREAKGREVGGIRAEYTVNGGIGFTAGVEMLPPGLYNPSSPPVSEVGWRLGGSQGGSLWSSGRVGTDCSPQQPQYVTPYQPGIPSFQSRNHPWNPSRFNLVRAHQTKPSPTLAARSFKQVCNEPKEHVWMPRTSNHTQFAKERRAAIMKSAQANRPLCIAQDSSRTFGRLMPHGATAIDRTANTGRSLKHVYTAPKPQENVQVPVARSAAILIPSTRDTTISEDWLPSSMKQQGSVPEINFDSFFDMDAYQNS